MAQFFSAGDLRETAKPVVIVDWDTGEALGATSSTALSVSVGQWSYIGGETVTCNGSVAANVPADATIFELRARGGGIYFNINGLTCNTGSPGHVPEDQAEIVGPLDNLLRLQLYGAAATVYAHLMYFKEA